MTVVKLDQLLYELSSQFHQLNVFEKNILCVKGFFRMNVLPAQNISFKDFKLIGFYSLGEWRPFLFLPFFLMFLLAIIANSILIYLIKSQKSLHSPMYVLIGVMAVLDLIMPMFFVPNMLLSLLFNLSGISLTGC